MLNLNRRATSDALFKSYNKKLNYLTMFEIHLDEDRKAANVANSQDKVALVISNCACIHNNNTEN